VKVPADFTKRGWEVNLNDLIRNNRTAREGIGRMETAGWGNLVTMLKGGGMLKSDVDPATVFTNDYIPPDAPKW
jgi:hypothetical protein